VLVHVILTSVALSYGIFFNGKSLRVKQSRDDACIALNEVKNEKGMAKCATDFGVMSSACRRVSLSPVVG